jgi:hypothetical protein
LSQRIADSVASASTDGDALTANQRTALVNEALFKLFDEGWNAVKGDIKTFIEMFPELQEDESITTNGSAEYTLGSEAKLRDFFAPVNALWGSVYIKVLPKHLYAIVKASRYDDYVPTITNPALIEISGKLNFFPTNGLDSEAVTLYYIKLPLNPATGDFLTQNGTYDSPFSDKWNSRIASLAEDLYRTIAQEKSQ